MATGKRTSIRRAAESVRLLDRADGDDSPRKVEVVASTETPVRVWGVDEVLSHKRGHVDLSRFRDAPVLVDHEMRVDSIVGRVVDARIAERRLVATAELRGGDGRIERMLDEGLLRDVSIGFSVREWKRTREAGGGSAAEYTATDWSPHEFSFVAVGADPSAVITGVRADYDLTEQEEKEAEMPDDDKREETPDKESITEAVRAAVVKDNAAIFQFADEYESVDGPAIARDVVAKGGGMDELKTRLFSAMNERLDKLIENGGERGEQAKIGMSRREVDSFSMCRLFLALTHPHDAGAQDRAGAELEACAEAAKQMRRDEAVGSKAGGIAIPVDVLRAPICNDRRVADRVTENLNRAVNTGADAAGGYLVADVLLASSYIDILRAMSAILPRATNLPDLVGNIEIPRLKTSVDPSWVEETPAGDTGLVEPAWDEVTLGPKKMYCGVPISHTMLIQGTPEVEGLVRMDILQQEVLKIDTAAFVGEGSANQPKGVENQDGVNVVAPASSTNGATLNRDLLIDMRTEIATANGITGMEAFFLHPLVGGKARKTRLVDGDAGAGEGFLWDMRTPQRPLIGMAAVETTTIPAAGAKGSGTELSTVFLGNPRTVLIGTWGGLDVQVDPYTMRRRGQVVVSCIRFCDIAIRQPKQFSVIKNVIGNK